MDSPEQTVARMTEAQKHELIQCVPYDVCVGAGIAISFCSYGFLEDSTITDDGVQLTAHGQAVRALLEKKP